jgi:hypothetical protein
VFDFSSEGLDLGVISGNFHFNGIPISEDPVSNGIKEIFL